MSVSWEEAKAGIERAVDALAAQVIGWPESDPSREWMQSIQALLDAISAQAEKIQSPAVARVAGQLAERSRQEGNSLLPALEQAIESMREELLQAAPAAEPDPAPEPVPEAAPLTIAEDPELLNDFVLEAREHLASIEENLLVLEREPHHTDSIHSVFRSFHTIKGLAGFLDLSEMQQVSHEVETVLDLARNDQLTITPEVIDVVLAAADHLKVWLAFVEGKLNGQPTAVPPNAHALLERVRTLHTNPHVETPLVGAVLQTPPPPMEALTFDVQEAIAEAVPETPDAPAVAAITEEKPRAR